MWHLVTRGNIQQISYIPQTEQHSPFGLMLLHLGNVTIMCMYVCMYVCMNVCSDVWEGEGGAPSIACSTYT